MDKKWSALWIGNEVCPAVTAPVFQKKFVLKEEAKNSRIYISGLGAYVLKVNGRRVGNDILQPAFSNYDKTVYYNVYDLDSYLVKGENKVEVTVGNVLYNEQQATCWLFESANWKSYPHLIAEIFVGDMLVAKTDRSWKCGESAVVFNSLRCGESYDATRKVEFTRNADIVPPPGGILKEQTILPIRVSKIYEPKEIITRSAFVGSLAHQVTYDFGINLSGNAQIRVRGKRGSKITLTYLERVSECGLPDNESLSGGLENPVDKARFQREEYILSGEGMEVWHSEFCYHGFRYIQVVGHYEELEIKARCFHTVLETAGDIETDHELVARIHSACKQSTKTNFHHVPTDCPHREKLGWTGDGMLSCEQAYFNFDMTHAYAKWMEDFNDSMLPSGKLPGVVPSSTFGYKSNYGPCYDGAMFIIPWEMYRYTGDRTHLERNFASMKKYIPFMKMYMDNGICMYGICDWLAVLDIGQVTPKEPMLTLLCGNLLNTYIKICDVLREEEEMTAAKEFYDDVRNAYIREFADLELNTQTMYAMELMFDFTDDAERTEKKLMNAVEKADYHITGGMFCAKYLLNALTKIGRFDAAYKIAMQEDYPGWGYLTKVNSGTLGENWAGGKSGNHHFLSEIGAWYYKVLAGFVIDESMPGFKHIFLTPHVPEDIKNFSAYHMTPYGKLSLSWNEKEIIAEIPEETMASFVYKDIKKELSGGKYVFER